MNYALNRKYFLKKKLLKKSFFILITAGLNSQIGNASGFGPLPTSFSGMQVPPVPGLLDGEDPIVVDKEKAIILGKALFWDTNVGSDGIACGSCHFHAGADSRIKNQLAPGGPSANPSSSTFEQTLSGQWGGPNYSLKKSDFPFHQLTNPFFISSAVTHDTDDVASSSGTFSGDYISSSRYNEPNDACERFADPVFHVGTFGTRRVEPRNTPTIVNSIFNHRNFWDGRANNVFNGSSQWGDRDPEAGIWVKINSRQVRKERLHLINSSIASLSLAPPLSTTEMSCAGRSLPALGRKLLSRKPLESQRVHYQDSVLGNMSYSDSTQLLPGLNTTYKRLIRQAFNRKYWSYSRRGQFGAPQDGSFPYNQIEANFGMFFGLSIQLYMSTLVSDQAPFDTSARDADGIPTELSQSAINGLNLFRDGQCARCHIGPNFTMASVTANAEFAKIHPEAFGNEQLIVSTTENVVNRALVDDGVAFFDTGFIATGVVTEDADLGVGSLDDFGNPLSFSQQYLQFVAGLTQNVVDNEVMSVRPCDFQEAFAINVILPFPQDNLFTPEDGVKPQEQSLDNCFNPEFAFLPTEQVALAELQSPTNRRMIHAVNGAFKVPTLRNIELTGPFMHNGGMSSLEQVIEFYSRGGNFSSQAKQSEKVFPLPALQFSEQNRADLIAFLKTLTDDRVRYKKAPFDHPEIRVPHGHTGDNNTILNDHELSNALAQDEVMVIDAVGANGVSEPLIPFVDLLPD